MTELPAASKIPILTPDNVLAVARVYLKQLSYTSIDVEESDRAVQFISTALNRLTKQNKSWEESYYHLDDHFMRVLRHTPHFRNNALLPLPEVEVAEWATVNGVEIDYIRHLSSDYYIFKSYEDSVLFKLRWT